METLETLVDWATEEESGRWTDETLTSVLELVSGMNTLTRRGNNMKAISRNFCHDRSLTAISGFVAFSIWLFLPHLYTKSFF